jgi:hypothetical protein
MSLLLCQSSVHSYGAERSSLVTYCCIMCVVSTPSQGHLDIPQSDEIYCNNLGTLLRALPLSMHDDHQI